MDFQITEEHIRLQQRCRQLAEDFAMRAALHDREATDPVENYAILRQAGFYALNVPKDLGGWGLGSTRHARVVAGARRRGAALVGLAARRVARKQHRQREQRESCACQRTRHGLPSFRECSITPCIHDSAAALLARPEIVLDAPTERCRDT